MRIFFTCSTKEMLMYKEFYKEIRNSILNLGHEINRDWLPGSIDNYEKKGRDISPSTVYEKVLSAILTADIVIVDATVRSMSIGHQISFALSKSKPVLVLRYVGSNGNIDDLFINNEKSSFLSIKKYKNMKDIFPTIKNYIANESEPKVRFNLVMTREQNKYVEWSSYKYRKSKTSVIQEAINEKMGNDLNYKKNY